MDVSTIAAVAQISTVIGGVLFGLWKIWRKIDVHQANSAARSDVLETRLDRIELQFGPNGGGLREAVNRISDSLSRMDKKLDIVSNDLSQLKGEFKEHVRDNDE
jgi:hypothetical protein